MVPNQFTLPLGEAFIVEFAGGGGSCEGYAMATGRNVDVAVNHDPEALAMHRRNHPQTIHYVKSVWEVDPLKVWERLGRRRVGGAWFSPDCKHFSKAKGGALLDKRVRGLAWRVLTWVGRGGGGYGKRGPMCPRVIYLENVEEWRSWGPLVCKRDKATGCLVRRDKTVAKRGEYVPYREQYLVPDPRRAGLYYRRWKKFMVDHEGEVADTNIRACDLGAPTIRTRLYAIVRFDGGEISWPKATHAASDSAEVREKRMAPFRDAASCIDFSRPCPSIFLTREEARKVNAVRPLVEATMRRIAKGVDRFVLKAAHPFIVSLTHHGADHVEDTNEPFKTVTAANRGEKSLVMPLVAYAQHGGAARPADAPLHTVAASPKDQNCVIAAHVVKMRGSSQDHFGGQPPGEPLHTICAGGKHFGVTAAFLAQHNSGMVGHTAKDPVSSIIANGCTQEVVGASLAMFQDQHNSNSGPRSVTDPASTVTSVVKNAIVGASVAVYYGTDENGHAVTTPMESCTSKQRFGLLTCIGEIPPFTEEHRPGALRVAAFLRSHGVEFEGEYAMVGDFVIYDIGQRMFTPRELFNAQSFPPTYVIDEGVLENEDGTLRRIRLKGTSQIRMAGNSVCPVVAEAIIRSNQPELCNAQAIAA